MILLILLIFSLLMLIFLYSQAKTYRQSAFTLRSISYKMIQYLLWHVLFLATLLHRFLH